MYYFDWTGLKWYELQFVNLSGAINSHPGSHWFCTRSPESRVFLLSATEQGAAGCFALGWLVLVEGGGVGRGVGGGGHKPHSTLSCHQCSADLTDLMSRRQSVAVVCFLVRRITILCGRTDRNGSPEAMADSVTLHTGGENLRWFYK